MDRTSTAQDNHSPFPVFQSTPAPYPTALQAFLLTLLLIAIQLAIGVCIGIAYQGRLPPTLVTALVNLTSFMVVLAVGLISGSLEPGRTFPFRAVRLGLIVPMILTSLGLFVLLADLDNFVARLLPLPKFLLDFFSDLAGAGKSPWMSVVVLVVIAPLTEELTFRGLFLTGLLQQYRTWAAIAITAALFAFAHMNPWQFPDAMVLGLLFGWWFWRTQSLWPCLLGHALHNGLPSILRLFPNLQLPLNLDSTSNVIVFQPLWFDLIGLVMVVIGMVWTQLIFGRMPPIARIIPDLAYSAPSAGHEALSVNAEPVPLQTAADPQLPDAPIWRAIDLRTQTESRLSKATFEFDEPAQDKRAES